jgi:hypothetical protein
MLAGPTMAMERGYLSVQRASPLSSYPASLFLQSLALDVKQAHIFFARAPVET